MYAVEKQHLEQKIDEFHAVEHELESSIKVAETLQDDIKSLKTIKILAEDDLCSELTTSKEKVEMLEVALISQKKNVASLRNDMKQILKHLKKQMKEKNHELEDSKNKINDTLESLHESESMRERMCEDIEREIMTNNLLEEQLASMHRGKCEVEYEYNVIADEIKKQPLEHERYLAESKKAIDSGKALEKSLRQKLSALENKYEKCMSERNTREKALKNQLKTLLKDIDKLNAEKLQKRLD